MERKTPVGDRGNHSVATTQAGGFLWDIETGIVSCDSVARQLIGFELGPDCDLLRLNDMLCQINQADKERVERSLSESVLVDVPFVIPFRIGQHQEVELRGEKCRVAADGRVHVLGVIVGGTSGLDQCTPAGVQETGLDALVPLINEALSISRSENLSFLTWLLRMALIEAGKTSFVAINHQ